MGSTLSWGRSLPQLPRQPSSWRPLPLDVEEHLCCPYPISLFDHKLMEGHRFDRRSFYGPIAWMRRNAAPHARCVDRIERDIADRHVVRVLQVEDLAQPIDEQRP